MPVFGDGDEGVEARLRFPNAAERILRQFNGRDLARAKFRRRFFDSHEH